MVTLPRREASEIGSLPGVFSHGPPTNSGAARFKGVGCSIGPAVGPSCKRTARPTAIRIKTSHFPRDAGRVIAALVIAFPQSVSKRRDFAKDLDRPFGLSQLVEEFLVVF